MYFDWLIWCSKPIFGILKILKKFRRVATKQQFGFFKLLQRIFFYFLEFQDFKN
jgi:hypothetical protein